MHSIDSFIHSNMFRVNFAGFSALGIDLQNKGWEFSAYQKISYNYDGYEIQLMMNHRGGGITMVSHLSLYNIHEIIRNQHYVSHKKISDFQAFEVMAVQINERSSFLSTPLVKEFNFTNSFSAIDASPSFERIDLSKIDFKKFGVFKKINDAANIFLPEKTVNEIMDEILSKQAPKQQEIRKNRKREEFMQEFNRNPNEDIKLQLIAV